MTKAWDSESDTRQTFGVAAEPVTRKWRGSPGVWLAWGRVLWERVKRRVGPGRMAHPVIDRSGPIHHWPSRKTKRQEL